MPYIEAEPFLQVVGMVLFLSFGMPITVSTQYLAVGQDIVIAKANQATDYVKTALDTDEVVIFTDRIQRSAFILAQDIIDGFEMPFKPYVFDQELHAKEIEKLLEKMIDNAELPHIFYKKAYVTGSRALGMQYESGELEERLSVVGYSPDQMKLF